MREGSSDHPTILFFTMPRDHANHYQPSGFYCQRTITRMTRVSYPRTRNSSRLCPQPYPSPADLISRVDAEGNAWYRDVGDDLHMRDFIWLTRMQSARRMEERVRRFSNRDLVMERLLEEGTFDRVQPDMPVACEQMAMGYAASMCQRLLMRVEHLESEVSKLTTLG
jgi:hypothetical protein